jgi:flavodoxin
MKTAVIYTSQTGFTKKYATWLSERTNAELYDLKDVQKKDDSFFATYDAIVYAGWFSAGKVVKANWFFDKAVNWKDKTLAVIGVGAGEIDDEQTKKAMDTLLTAEQSEYIRAFYCQGGLSYENMNAPTRVVMKMFANSIKNKKNATEKEKKMGEMFARSFDATDIKFLDPVVRYLEEAQVTSA